MKTLLLTTLALALTVTGTSFAGSGFGGKGGGKHGGGFSGRFGSNFGGKHGGGYSGGFGGNFGGNSNRNQHCNSNYGGGNSNYGGGYSSGGSYQSVGQAYEPFHSSYFVQPGDTFYEVSLKEYGTSANAQHIARFNRLTFNAALVPGQRLMLPSVAANGTLSQSRAPAPQAAETPTAKLAQPQPATSTPSTTSATGVDFASSDAALPSVAVGSALALDGVQFGEASGSVRLKFGPVSFPATVLEWTAETVKVQLPTVELESATPAAIEVFRADGSLASQSKVKLTPAGTQVAKTE